MGWLGEVFFFSPSLFTHIFFGCRFPNFFSCASTGSVCTADHSEPQGPPWRLSRLPPKTLNVARFWRWGVVGKGNGGGMHLFGQLGWLGQGQDATMIAGRCCTYFPGGLEGDQSRPHLLYCQVLSAVRKEPWG